MTSRLVTALMVLGLAGALVVPCSSYAQSTSTYQKRPLNYYEQTLKQNTKLGGYDNVATSGPTVTAARIINWLLLLLGVVAISLTVYAGMIWLLSRGNEDEVKRAKDILAGSVIGLLIILSSYSLSAYIFNTWVFITD